MMCYEYDGVLLMHHMCVLMVVAGVTLVSIISASVDPGQAKCVCVSLVQCRPVFSVQ